MNATTDCAPMLTIYTREGKNGTNIANAEYAGTIYEITSRQSAVFKLCRDISEAGAEDCAFQVINGTTGTIGYSGLSWRFLAGLTVVETDARGPRLAKFQPISERLAKGRKISHPITAPATAPVRVTDGHCVIAGSTLAPHPFEHLPRRPPESGLGVKRHGPLPWSPSAAEISARQRAIEAKQRDERNVDKPMRLRCEAVEAPATSQATQAPPGPATPCSLDTSPLEIDVTMKPALPLPFDAPGITLDDLLSA